ncbi:hypothetical protein Voc01_053880 [Virgisporangium ochraceum]|uniref:Uncharacterized protein n=1 Tax=Virgisporangium ochraceum TaxID=65505 RepID=A0A8J3ZVL5_9ACTN|nr:hypothetical protein Voc01_053880 [Virgisporangium ochraceum]
MVTSAFATTHGIDVAATGTAALDRSPTPPPSRTNLANDLMTPTIASGADSTRTAR